MVAHIPTTGTADRPQGKKGEGYGGTRSTPSPFQVTTYSISAVSLSVAPLLSVQEISSFSPLAAPVNLKDR